MTEAQKHRILLVDDEPAITKSLYRLFRKDGYIIDICDGGEAGLKILSEATEPFSLIISDQRMPGMNGSQFLEKAAVIAPDAIRFLLTGYSDLQAVVDAVNKGKIHRYLTKPWNDEALLLHTRQALQEVELRRENERLTLLTKHQNKQLYELGVSLEKKVRERTQKLIENNAELETLNRKLEDSFSSTVRLILSLVEATNKPMGSYMRHVGRLSKRVALQLGMDEKEVRVIETAGQLHDIGMFGLPEKFMYLFESELSGEELQRYRQHPGFAAISLETVEKFSNMCEIVLHHHERFNGKGFPDGLKGEDIPLGARILAPVSDYCRIMNYWPKSEQVIRKKMKDHYGIPFDIAGIGNVDELLQIAAEKILSDGIHEKYDERIIDVLIRILRKPSRLVSEEKRGLVPLENLKPGMVIPQDLFMNDGRMLLAQSTVLDNATIRSIQKIGQMKMISDAIAVTIKE